MVAGVGDKEVSGGIESHSRRCIEAGKDGGTVGAAGDAGGSSHGGDHSGCGDFADGVVVGVRDVEGAGRVAGETARVVEAGVGGFCGIEAAGAAQRASKGGPEAGNGRDQIERQRGGCAQGAATAVGNKHLVEAGIGGVGSRQIVVCCGGSRDIHAILPPLVGERTGADGRHAEDRTRTGGDFLRDRLASDERCARIGCGHGEHRRIAEGGPVRIGDDHVVGCGICGGDGGKDELRHGCAGDRGVVLTPLVGERGRARGGHAEGARGAKHHGEVRGLGGDDHGGGDIAVDEEHRVAAGDTPERVGDGDRVSACGRQRRWSDAVHRIGRGRNDRAVLAPLVGERGWARGAHLKCCRAVEEGRRVGRFGHNTQGRRSEDADADPCTVRVDHIEVAQSIGGDPSRRSEAHRGAHALAGAGPTGAARHGGDTPRGADFTDELVGRVGHVQVAGGIHGERLRGGKASGWPLAIEASR